MTGYFISPIILDKYSMDCSLLFSRRLKDENCIDPCRLGIVCLVIQRYGTQSNEEPIIERIKISSITFRNRSLSTMCLSASDNVGNKFTISLYFFGS